MHIRPLDIMVTGVTGAGKSTTLNALFGDSVATVGNGVDPETMELDSYNLHDYARIWDTPGLGDGIAQDKKHSKKIIELLHKTYTVDEKDFGWIDLVLVIIEGTNRDMGTTYTLINDVLLPHIQEDRVLVAINQADIAMKGRYWDHTLCRPKTELKEFLDNQALSIQRRVKEATNLIIPTPIYYSAEYNYNMRALMDLIIDNIPQTKRPIK